MSCGNIWWYLQLIEQDLHIFLNFISFYFISCTYFFHFFCKTQIRNFQIDFKTNKHEIYYTPNWFEEWMDALSKIFFWDSQWHFRCKIEFWISILMVKKKNVYLYFFKLLKHYLIFSVLTSNVLNWLTSSWQCMNGIWDWLKMLKLMHQLFLIQIVLSWHWRS